MTDLKKIFLFRMTHIDNVPHIIQNGITHLSSINFNPLFISIGDSSLISKRHSISLPCGKQLSDFIPFYFGGRMPMLYVIQKGFNGVNLIHPKEIVYFVTNVTNILNHNLKFYFSDKHAVNKLAKFYDLDAINEIDSIIDYKAVNDLYWNKEDDTDFKSRKEAEFLIEPNIPYSTLGTFIVYNEDAKQKMLTFGIDGDKIKVNSQYYF